jgi:hypothetical protein
MRARARAEHRSSAYGEAGSAENDQLPPFGVPTSVTSCHAIGV